MARVPLAILAVGLLLVAACGGEDTPVARGAGPASLLQLTGPMATAAVRPRARPCAAAIEQACRCDMERGPGSVAAIVDVRGKAVAVVRMVGQGAGTCDALEITAARQDQWRRRRSNGERRRAAGTNRGDRARGSPGRVRRRRQPEGPGMVGDRACRVRASHRSKSSPRASLRSSPRSRTAGSPGGGLPTCRRASSGIRARRRTSWCAATTRPARFSTKFALEHIGAYPCS